LIALTARPKRVTAVFFNSIDESGFRGRKRDGVTSSLEPLFPFGESGGRIPANDS
jgi:hypothetical protein